MRPTGAGRQQEEEQLVGEEPPLLHPECTAAVTSLESRSRDDRNVTCIVSNVPPPLQRCGLIRVTSSLVRRKMAIAQIEDYWWAYVRITGHLSSYRIMLEVVF